MPDEIRTIDCRAAVRRLWDYLDGELDDARMLEVQQHLERCAECVQHAAFGRRFLDALARVGAGHAMPDSVRAEVMATLSAAGYHLE